MSGERYVLLGLASPRAAWFGAVSRWATSGALPAEFLKCVSGEELRVRLDLGRPASAVLLDGQLGSVDRDLLDAVRTAGCVALVVDAGGAARDWTALGAVAVLPAAFGPETLLDALATHAPMVRDGRLHGLVEEPSAVLAGLVAPVAAVCGPGGTGASTAAAALAQGLAARATAGRDVLLADLCLHAEQAMIHDVGDVVPGVQELVDAHRSRRPDGGEVRALTFVMEERGYHLLLGLRRARYWTALRPRALEAAMESLRNEFDVVVCDVDGDLDGEEVSGSVEVEERNLMARTVVAGADVVFAVGAAGVKGVHSLARLLGDLAAFGVPPQRLVPVVNRAPRSPRERAAIAAAVADLADAAVGGGGLASPVFLPRRRVEESVRDGARIPGPLPALLSGAFDAVVARDGGSRLGRRPEAVRVAPGSLGHWVDGVGPGGEEVA